MFDKLKSAFSSVVNAFTERTLSENQINELLGKLEVDMLESDVAYEVAQNILTDLKQQLANEKVKRASDTSEIIIEKFRHSIEEIFAKTPTIDFFSKIAEKNSTGNPYVMTFLGINGTGKTTTIAKFSNMLRKKGLSVVIAAGDTHRAGAIEQLSEHADRLGIKVVSQRYGSDPAAVARDAVMYAKNHHVNVVIVDTAGRIQTSKNLMEEMAKIVRVVKPDLKIFVGDSLAGNDAISQAKEFLAATDYDGVVLTKVDADARGGAALSIASVTGRPILYLGIGQEYDDLIPFEPAFFTKNLFNRQAVAAN
ncbi:MAG: signal recognition particle-docking protein FtsY [Thaumarchaeota archaeon]|nr:signal recognition particle-docking protein FtsY [Nitrososphaerota archaeon]